MSDREPAPAAARDGETAESNEAGAQPPALPSSAPDARLGGAVAAGLAAALLLVIGLVATAPLWAPLLPWGPAADHEAERLLRSRLDRLEAVQAQVPQQLEQLRQQMQQPAAETKTSLQRLDQRVEILEARPAPSATGDIAELRQETAALSRDAAELASRIDAVEKNARARTTRDTADAALVIGLLQIRAAVQAGRPFAAEYDAFAALARGDPDIAAAAAALAEPAKTGLAGPAVLAKRLHELAGGIVAGTPASPPDPSAAGWGDAALARLRGLVTIRRIDGARPEEAGAPVNAAELALAGGDLAAAVAALDKLTGAPADTAGPWLRMARQRLAVDDALRRLEALLTARLGSPSGGPGSAG